MASVDLSAVDRLLSTTRTVRKRLDLDRPVAYAIGDDFKLAPRRPVEDVTCWNSWE